MSGKIGQYKTDLSELKTKQIALKQALYKKYVMMRITKYENELEKLRNEIKELENDYESICDLIDEKEEKLNKERERQRKR